MQRKPDSKATNMDLNNDQAKHKAKQGSELLILTIQKGIGQFCNVQKLKKL